MLPLHGGPRVKSARGGRRLHRGGRLSHNSAAVRSSARFWKLGTTAANAMVERDVEDWLDKKLTKLCVQAEREGRRGTREKERVERMRWREQMKLETSIDKEVRLCLEKCIRKLEVDVIVLDNGRPYAENVTNKGSFSPLGFGYAPPHIYRVSGLPCSEWLSEEVAAISLDLQRSATTEVAVRTALREENNLKRMLRLTARAPRKEDALIHSERGWNWLSPTSRGHKWTTLALRYEGVR